MLKVLSQILIISQRVTKRTLWRMIPFSILIARKWLGIEDRVRWPWSNSRQLLRSNLNRSLLPKCKNSKCKATIKTLLILFKSLMKDKDKYNISINMSTISKANSHCTRNNQKGCLPRVQEHQENSTNKILESFKSNKINLLICIHRFITWKDKILWLMISYNQVWGKISY